MYLSRIILNINKRDTIRAMSSPQILHGAVESSLGFVRNESERTLWRLDILNGQCCLLIQSCKIPIFEQINEQLGFGLENNLWDAKELNNLFNRLDNNQLWRFRLRANPVYSKTKNRIETKKRGKVVAHVTATQQKDWLIERSQRNGFLINNDSFDVVFTDWKKFRKKNGNEVTLRIADFEGVLKIQNIERFKNTIISGIGRGKAYGCGLLTIAPYEGD
ncbi:type I-E CRISPR-associated protein Cas6/Cse3/CasE [Alkalibacter saccharofermentans]|uniref:CRISPR system Cascade subunit CasE n=1 Tax=Alkalibacter saccharofermentans DSM 14828 TaxID=1120975 RepID=A0A1M4V9K2_9FIRM|nr:type I-E CRISPR-associated protein Cas6/Cse3/CasE [Alkalibacter saccharofermentans]SHE65671.1 CRISPR system Cascade subunit CasE [Alkalibacter saccharofermentans DSM 14828]